MLLLTGCWTTGQGEKVGTVIKVADEGLFRTTHEFEIVRGGMNGGQGSFSIKPSCITVEDTELLQQVRAAFNSQREIVVMYRQELFAPLRSSGECGEVIFDNKFLTSIQVRGEGIASNYQGTK